MEGATIGPYRVVRKIGAGGMGAVYLAEHTLVGRRAAIKVLLPEWSVRRDIVTRFFNEARAMSAVPDPGIVQMFDFGFAADGCAYIVMELLEGETLQQRRRRLGRLAVMDALRLTRQIAGTLAAAHARGIIHRDLKPENVFIVRDPEAPGGERPKLLDFGIAKLSGNPDPSYTLPGQMLGTPVYMSPEQARGADEVDERTDIYSLGCVLYALIAGRPPFKRAGMGELISAHINDTPDPPSMHAPDVPAELDELMARCLEKSRERRLQSMTELQERCEMLLSRYTIRDVGTPAHSLVVPLPTGFRSGVAAPDSETIELNPTTLSAAVGETPVPVHPGPQRRGVVTASAALVALAIGGVLVFGIGRNSESDRDGDTAEPAVLPATSPEPPRNLPMAPAPAADAAVETTTETALDAALETATPTVPDAPPDAAPAVATPETAPPATRPEAPNPRPKVKAKPTRRPKSRAPEPPVDLYEGR